MRILKIFFKIGASFLALILMLYALFMLYLYTAGGQETITSYVVNILDNTLSAETKISSIHTNIISTIDIEELSIVSEGDTIAYLNKAHVSYSLLSLIFGGLTINDVEIDSLIACVKRDSIGFFELKLLNPQNENSDSSASSVSIDNFSIRRSKLCYDDRSIPLSVTGQNVYANMSLKNNVFNVSANLHSLHFDYFKKALLIDSLNFSAAISSSNILIDTLSLQVPELTIEGKLNIGLSDTLSLSGNFQGKGRPYKILEAIINKKQLTHYYKDEKTTFDISLDGNITDLYISSAFSKITLLSAPVLKSEISLILKDNQIDIKNADLSVFGGRITGDAIFSTNKSNKYSLNLNFENLKTNSLIPSSYGKIPLREMTLNGYIKSAGKFSDIKQINLNSKLELHHNVLLKNNFITEVNIKEGIGDLCIRHSADNCVSLSVQLHDSISYGTFYGVIDSVEFLAKQLNLPPINGSVLFDGYFDWPEIQAQIRARSIHYKNMPVDTAYAEIYYTDSKISFKRLYFASSDTIINPYDIKDISTIINYNGELSGNIDSLSGQLNASLNNLSINGYQIDTVYTEIEYNNLILNIDSLSIQKNNALLSLKGNIDTKLKKIDLDLSLKNSGKGMKCVANYSDSLYQLNFKGSRIAIQDIIPFIPAIPDWEGIINLNFTASTNPQLTNAKGILELFAEKPSYHKTTYADSIKINAEFSRQRLQIDTLQYYLSGENAVANMIFDFSDSTANQFNIAHTEGQIYGKNIDLKVFNPLMPDKYILSGSSTHDFSWNGSYSHPNFDGFLKVNNARVIKNEDEAIADDINISVSISDTLIKIDSVAFKNNSIPLMTKGQFDIDNDKITVRLNSFIKDKKIFNISGYTTYDSISLKSDLNNFNLSLLNPFMTSLQDIRGYLSSIITIEGDINNPDINGNLTIRQLAFDPEYVDVPVENGIIAIKLKDNVVFIDTLNLPIKKGSFSLSGDFGIDTLSVSYFNLKANLDNIDILDPDMFHIFLSEGKLTLTTKNGIHLLGGELFLGDSKYFRDLKLDDLWELLLSKSESTYTDKANTDIDILSFYEENLNTSDIAIPEFLKNTVVDINLENRGDLWVYNNVADFYLTINLNFSGEIINPALTGRIDIKENGRMNFLDRVFEIKKGTFEFVDVDKINPMINLSAESEIDIPSGDGKDDNTYLIDLLIDGPLDQMNISLTSQPSMEPSDIISLLTLGMTYNEISSLSSSTESSDALKKRSGEIAGQIISQKMNNYLKKILGNEGGNIDFELHGNIFDMNDTRVAVNKRWGKRVTISYSTSIKDFDKRIIHIEYKITNDFSVEGQTNQDQESAVDFKYRIRFK